MTSTFEMLCHPLSLGDLLATWRAGRWQLIEHAPERLAELAALPELDGVDGVLRAVRGGSLSAYAVDGAGELLHIPLLRPLQAAKVFAMGGTLTCVNFEDHSPELRRIAGELAAALGVKPQSVSVIAFCSPPRARISFLHHFDPFDSFSVQLHGCKTWHIGTNLDVAHPYHPWPMSDAEMADAEARVYMPASWSPDTRASLEPVVMRSGSVLFVGRGCWHGTGDVGDEASVALSFVFTTDSYSAIVRQALALVMAADPAWREPGVGMLIPDAGRADAEARLAARLDELRTLLAGMSAGDLLDAYARACNPRESR